MQGIYHCIPETEHVSRVYSGYVSRITSCSIMCAAPNMAVFCISLISRFPRYVAQVF